MLSDSTLGEFFRAAIDIPEIPFGEMLWESAQRFPEKVALVFQGQKISYRELDGLANSFANALAKLGVKKGDRVALYMTNRPEYIISVYGIARLGAVFTPMNPTYKEGEIEHQLNDAERICDRFVLLNAGSVRGRGSLNELRQQFGLGAGTLEDIFLALERCPDLRSRRRRTDAAAGSR